MPVLVVGREGTLEELDRRLFRTGVTDTAVRRLRTAIRDGNPDVDFTDLRPGTVIRLPRDPELRARDDLSFDDSVTAALGATRDSLTADVKALAAVARGRQRDAAAERKEARSLLGSREVTAAAAQDPGIARAVSEIDTSLRAEDEADGARQEATKAALSEWADGLAVLDRLAP
jgi:hypothetical protein